MHIKHIEIGNFRKLRAVRIDFDIEKTLLVGANNSGKTSAMLAFRKFFLASKEIELRDISIDNWVALDQMGVNWESGKDYSYAAIDLFPLVDVWLNASLNEIHHIIHIIPNVDWIGGLVGVRLQYELKDIEQLKVDYLDARTTAKKIEDGAPKDNKPSIEPRCLVEFLDGHLSKYIELRAYSLDPAKCTEPDNKGRARMQTLPEEALQIEGNPFDGLIDIREIPALRDFSSSGFSSSNVDDIKTNRVIRTLSDHVRSYYDKHVDKIDEINSDDVLAFSALQQAEKAFDKRLKTGFSSVFEELEDLGIPGINNPSIVINTKFKSLDGLSHSSAVQYKVCTPHDGQQERYLPESYAGLGYQNLIAMVFLLMRFRQDWVEPKVPVGQELKIAPMQLVMIEEPEAHLHAQVQQVFIKKAYNVLRNHKILKESISYSTQLLVSTHSSHVAHEVDFANLRYFRRLIPETQGRSPISTIINLSNVFGEDKETLRFVKRYIKATDCDLFFADGAIFVEGQAERILIPHFIRHHFDGLWKRYISLIDLGGSNAPRLKPLIKALGLTSLIITDLDAGIKVEITDKNGNKTSRIKKAKPQYKANQVTTNPTLKDWHPNLPNIDDLLALKADGHQCSVNDEYDLYVAYQKQTLDPTISKGQDSKGEAPSFLIPRTFEDALVYENYDLLKDISGSSTTNKISLLISQNLSGADLETELFEIVDKAEKAAFAIDCLMAGEDGSSISPPSYIRDGLAWLEDKLKEPALIISTEDKVVANG